MAIIEDELQRLWQLLAELSSQLTQNREQTELIKKQAEDLKTQAIHTETGYALKRFNVDLSQEQFDSELERMNAQLVIENQTLQYENRQLAILLKDHESTLEQIMSRFRNHAHTTQQHEIELTKYYESTILSILEKQNQREMNNQVNEIDPSAFEVIQSISLLIHKALRELSGEEAELDLHQASDTISSNSQTSMIKFQDPFHKLNHDNVLFNQNSAKNDDLQRRKSTSIIDYKPRARDPSTGGFIGKRKNSLSDYALLSAIESEKLRRENDYLREMLAISNDFSLKNPPPNNPSYSTRFENLNHDFDSNNSNDSVIHQVIKEEDHLEDPSLSNHDPSDHLSNWPQNS